MAFQNPVLLELRTILENVILPLEIIGSTLTANQRKERARHLLALVGLDGFEEKDPPNYPGACTTGPPFVARLCINQKY